jgi:hypothetical protein
LALALALALAFVVLSTPAAPGKGVELHMTQASPADKRASAWAFVTVVRKNQTLASASASA